MTQQPDGIRRDADLHGVTPLLLPAEEKPPPDEFTQAVHFVGLTIMLYLLYALCSAAAFARARNAGFYDWYYGSAFVADAVRAKDPDQAAQTRLQLWALGAAFPCWLTTTGLKLLWFLPSACRRDIGVSLGRFPRGDGECDANKAAAAPWSLLVNGMIAIAAWLVLTPLTLGVNFLLVWLFSRNAEVAPEEHPFTAAAQGGGMRHLEWGMLALSVMVSARLLEELRFRGLLPALCRKLRGTGGFAPMMLALAVGAGMPPAYRGSSPGGQRRVAALRGNAGAVRRRTAADLRARVLAESLEGWPRRLRSGGAVWGGSFVCLADAGGAVHSGPRPRLARRLDAQPARADCRSCAV